MISDQRSSIPRLHVITDESVQTRFSSVELAKLAVRGGAGAVQFREKAPISTRQRSDRARAIVEACEAHQVLVVVNDRLDVALAVGAGAVHLGRDDLPLAAARRIAPELCVGATAHTIEEARAAEPYADYLGVGPVYGTRSKANAKPTLGLEAFEAIVRATSLPVIAIGGVRAEHVPELLASGAHGVAVLSYVVSAAHPDEATAACAEAIRLAGSAGSAEQASL